MSPNISASRAIHQPISLLPNIHDATIIFKGGKGGHLERYRKARGGRMETQISIENGIQTGKRALEMVVRIVGR